MKKTTTFKDLNLNKDIIKSLDEMGFVEPSPIQEKAIPFLLKSKKDLIALAQTGTGKTAAFSLPILNQIKTDQRELQAIILCPTRELCLQISRDIKTFAKHSKDVVVVPVYGGERMDFQIRSLRSGAHIVVGTPGRVHDMIRRKILKLQNIKWLVLDEADEMLDMGFKEDLDVILKETPETRQTFLFSATMSKGVHAIAKKYMKEAEEISIGEKNVGAEKVSHEYYVVHAKDRFEALRRILDYLPGVYGILFCRTKYETQEVAEKLKHAHYSAEAMHGDIAQNMRTKIMERFRQKQIHLLVATDVAARGIDVSDLSHVINYNLPDQNEAYTHRSGRTGRAQKSGVSVSIVGPRDLRRISALERIIGKQFERKQVPSGKDILQKQIDNFVGEIEAVNAKEAGIGKHFSEIAEKLEKVKKEDLVKYFVVHKFGHLVDEHKNAHDLNAEGVVDKKRMDDADSVGLKVNLGKRHGLDVRSIFALINSSANLKGVEVGRINLMPEYSIFSVDKRRADEVVRSLQGINFRGKKVDIKKSDMPAGYSEERGGRERRGFGGRGRSRGRRSFRR